jgi:hypothetical protein
MAKITMTVQSLVSLAILALVIACAVNVLAKPRTRTTDQRGLIALARPHGSNSRPM